MSKDSRRLGRGLAALLGAPLFDEQNQNSAGGAALKKIGTLARKELEHLFDRKVFLQTFVKVRAGWRQDPEFLTAVDWR